MSALTPAQTLALLLLQEIEAALGDLLSEPAGRLDDDTRPLLEALLMALDCDDAATRLDELLSEQASRVETNARQPHRLLVWDSDRGRELLELELPELLEQYPCHGEQARWRPDDVVALLEAKAQQWRRTKVALERLRNQPSSHASGGTVLLVVSQPGHAPLEQAALTIEFSPSTGARPPS